MDKHINLLKQLLEWWWDSDIDGYQYNRWERLTPLDKKHHYKTRIYYILKIK